MKDKNIKLDEGIIDPVLADTWKKLKNHDIPPRIGDFIRSKLAPACCGIVTAIDFINFRDSKITGYWIVLGNGKRDFIDNDNYEFIAPRETQ
jgi:hypothetical protein